MGVEEKENPAFVEVEQATAEQISTAVEQAPVAVKEIPAAVKVEQELAPVESKQVPGAVEPKQSAAEVKQDLPLVEEKEALSIVETEQALDSVEAEQSLAKVEAPAVVEEKKAPEVVEQASEVVEQAPAVEERDTHVDVVEQPLVIVDDKEAPMIVAEQTSDKKEDSVEADDLVVAAANKDFEDILASVEANLSQEVQSTVKTEEVELMSCDQEVELLSETTNAKLPEVENIQTEEIPVSVEEASVASGSNQFRIDKFSTIPSVVVTTEADSISEVLEGKGSTPEVEPEPIEEAIICVQSKPSEGLPVKVEYEAVEEAPSAIKPVPVEEMIVSLESKPLEGLPAPVEYEPVKEIPSAVEHVEVSSVKVPAVVKENDTNPSLPEEIKDSIFQFTSTENIKDEVLSSSETSTNVHEYIQTECPQSTVCVSSAANEFLNSENIKSHQEETTSMEVVTSDFETTEALVNIEPSPPKENDAVSEKSFSFTSEIEHPNECSQVSIEAAQSFPVENTISNSPDEIKGSCPVADKGDV